MVIEIFNVNFYYYFYIVKKNVDKKANKFITQLIYDAVRPLNSELVILPAKHIFGRPIRPNLYFFLPEKAKRIWLGR